MIYELRTYTLKVRALPKVLQLFAERLEHRQKYSPLGAFWYTEIGPLNQIIHVWPYESLDERDRVRAEAGKDPNWPPPVHEYIDVMTSEIMIPFPSSPELKPAKLGPIYEMRSYMLKAGAVPTLRRLWEEKIVERVKLTPLCAVWTSEIGDLNKLVHIWPYESLEQRAEVRAKAVEIGAWPPDGGHLILTQENKIMFPAEFSPLQ